MFFASKNVNRKEYIKKWEEPFAFKVVNQKRFRDTIIYVKKESDRGKCKREPISWELYRALNGYDINTHTIGKGFIPIDDTTTDIDSLEEVKMLEDILKKEGE